VEGHSTTTTTTTITAAPSGAGDASIDNKKSETLHLPAL